MVSLSGGDRVGSSERPRWLELAGQNPGEARARHTHTHTHTHAEVPPKFQLQAEQSMHVRKPPRMKKEPPKKTTQSNPWRSHGAADSWLSRQPEWKNLAVPRALGQVLRRVFASEVKKKLAFYMLLSFHLVQLKRKI